MADEFKLTKEIMEKAHTYIPVSTKEAIANVIARACVKGSDGINFLSRANEPQDPLAENNIVYGENTGVKARFMMGILLSYYLDVRGEEDDLLCEIEEYDKWAGAHIINQIERYKSGEYREKAFDILTDYRETEKYINTAIYTVLREMNDPVKRIMEVVQTVFNADSMQNAVEEAKELKEQIEEEKERQERIIRGEEVADDGTAE